MISNMVKFQTFCMENMTSKTPLIMLDQLWQKLHIAEFLHHFCFSFLFLFLAVYLFKLRCSRRIKLNLPPSPPKFPIIGNLSQIGPLPHHSIKALSDKYGPLMLLHFGSTQTLVVSSSDMAREMFTTHDIIFSNRPKTLAANIFLYGCKDVGFSPYGDYWRKARKLCVVELLSLNRVNSFQLVRDEEVAETIDSIRGSCLRGSLVNLSELMIVLSANIVSRCVIGRKADAGEDIKLGKLARKFTKEFNEFSFSDRFPVLGYLIDVLTGFVSRLKETSREFDAFLDQVIEEYKTNNNGDKLVEDDRKKNFVRILVQLQESDSLDVELTRDKMKAILLDMFVAGIDTTSTTLEWTMAELMRNQNTMKKAQEEVRRVVGKKSKVESDDINMMNYLKSAIKESLRLHPPAPLLVPRETSATIKLGGYDVPPKTSVIINAMTIQRDPKVWERPEEFWPERFEENPPVDYRIHDFEFIAFGGGRRQCPGLRFGVTSVEYILANLLYWFDWRLPGGGRGEELDMAETYGLTVHKKVPLHLEATPYSS